MESIYSNIDRDIMNAPNKELLNQINQFYESALKD